MHRFLTFIYFHHYCLVFFNLKTVWHISLYLSWMVRGTLHMSFRITLQSFRIFAWFQHFEMVMRQILPTVILYYVGWLKSVDIMPLSSKIVDSLMISKLCNSELVQFVCDHACLSLSSVLMEWVFIMNRMSSQGSSATQRKRMALGVVILLLVDVIWVASSELTSVRILSQSVSCELVFCFICVEHLT